MKRKWIRVRNEDDSDLFFFLLVPYFYKCKICGMKRRKKRDLIFHISTDHSKWERRGTPATRSNYAFYFIGKKPQTEAINLGSLFLNTEAINLGKSYIDVLKRQLRMRGD